MIANNWWNALSENEKQNVWYNEVVAIWWSGLNLSNKIALSNKIIGSIQYAKVTKEQKIEMYKQLSNAGI